MGFLSSTLLSIWLYMTLPWLYFSLLVSTWLYPGSTWVYFILHYHGSTSLYIHYCTLALIDCTLLYHGSTSLYLISRPFPVTWNAIKYWRRPSSGNKAIMKRLVVMTQTLKWKLLSCQALAGTIASRADPDRWHHSGLYWKTYTQLITEHKCTLNVPRPLSSLHQCRMGRGKWPGIHCLCMCNYSWDISIKM